MKFVNKRRLRTQDVKVFQFLWRWKLATPILLFEVLNTEKITFRRFWKKLRRLVREGYLETESGFLDEDITLYRLSKKGFLHFMKSTDYMPEKRFKPQAIYHDYLATCFNLMTSFRSNNAEIQHWTEYEATVNEVGNFPEWVPGRKEHIPDGYSLITNKKETSLIAFEIEISQKSQDRYLKILSFFGGAKSEYDFVFWLVFSKRLAEKILASKRGPDYMDLSKHQFFLLDDFIKSGWNTKCFLGTTKGKTLSEIYHVLLGHASGSSDAHPWVLPGSLPLEKIYFSSIISPNGFKNLIKAA